MFKHISRAHQPNTHDWIRTSTMVYVPQDIVDLIIDQLCSTTLYCGSFLRATSLVSTAWVNGQSAPSLLHPPFIFQLKRAEVVLQNQTWSPRDFKTRTRPPIIIPIGGFSHPRDCTSSLRFVSKPSRTGHRGGCGAPESYRHPRPSPLLVHRYSQATSMYTGLAELCHSRLDMGISLFSRQFLAKPHRDQPVQYSH